MIMGILEAVRKDMPIMLLLPERMSTGAEEGRGQRENNRAAASGFLS